MKRRADIDGLRAVAVIPIMLFHAGVAAIPGGFTGVDIFYVISGFLITSIIVGEVDGAGFSLLRFYQRRIVRIFPALFVMLAVCLAVGAATMLPIEMRDMGRSAAAAAGFVSNIYFWRTSAYFSGDADSKPLLHTWSLGVEEQFYLFFPLVVMAIARWGSKRYLLWFAAIVLASFVLSVGAIAKAPTATFYLLPTRAWELGFGSLLAIGAAPRIASPLTRSLLALLGLGLIGYGLFFLRSADVFPGANALFPVVGATLLIAYGETGITARLMQLAPMQFIGRISFSLYLWHWPIIVFYRLHTGAELVLAETVALVAASIAAGAISYRFIEQPVQARYRGAAARPVVQAGLVGALAAVLVGGVVSTLGTRITGYPRAITNIEAFADYRRSPPFMAQFRRDTCLVDDSTEFDAAACLRIDPARRNVLLFGDSHAAMLAQSLAERMPDDNLLQATVAGCPPTLDVALPACAPLMRSIFRDLLMRGDVDAVILTARWQARDLSALPATLAYLRARGLPVVVIGPTVEYRADFPPLLARAVLRGDGGHTASDIRPEQARLDRAMAPIVARAGARYVSIYDIICPKGKCVTQTADGTPMQFDYGHLTKKGADLAVARMPAL